MREAAQRIIHAARQGYRYTILYAGDHDPSGSDMSRDIRDRLQGFGAKFDFCRIALNMEQVEKYRLPPNRIKESDSRSGDYSLRYGKECWELDALPPSELIRLIDSSIRSYINAPSVFNSRKEKVEQGRKILRAFSSNYHDLADLVKPSSNEA